MSPTIAAMRRLLTDLEPLVLEIEDQSHRHIGHAGAAAGGGHFDMTIVSPRFIGKRPLERHRLVYDALRSLKGPHGFHALSITAKAPDEI
ncbi:hypothetical protein B9N43_00225 [Denitratisoma sp. DHT3]|uniref:BolA family protein n=1 Tax=Denitratisoma sp. DHT3 TaxID=1981880 RepID=UPI00119897C5|nr:BolA family protein [Denitratisoma sp. DHT3]QDX79829.1 hypothetical protein B9N43_00225 [Denitratisoma sp. DHT3]